ncbi:MAG: ABC transporter ATP-binding protein [Phycisphaerae bacterium]
MASQTHPANHAMQPSVLRALDVCKSFGDRPALVDVSLDVPSGAWVAVLGANGAGKSTLLAVLATLVRPGAGELWLFGEKAGPGGAHLRARVGLIGHRSLLYRELSVRENLEFYGRLYGVPYLSDRINDVLALVDLTDRAEDAVKTLSRGMRQRAAIARALLHEPDLLLADEPFSGLDAPARRALEHVLTERNRAGTTIVMAHHDVDQSLRMAGQVVVLRRGRVVVDRCARQLDARTAVREMSAA